MKQVQMKTLSDALTLGQKAIKGSTVHNDLVVINTAATITLDLTALVLARDNYELGKALASDRRGAVRTTLGVSREALAICRDIFKPYFGSEYNESWDITGLRGSIGIPRSADDVQPLLLTFKTQLAAHPEREHAGLEATAVHFDALYTNIIAAQNAVITQDAAVQSLKALRDEKLDALTKRIRDLMGELAMKIGPMDPRWLAFGFNLPGAEETPEIPSNLSVILIGPNAAAMKWSAAVRAGYYRIWKRVVGVDAEPVGVGTPADLDFTLENLPANATIEISISAVNDGGESARSESVTIVTH
ncbi:MAG: hypothetical protein JWM68_3918 [Verrucomicrobiales bacterium]|nr:hypothetical protein [Verrucomicrobiales bacterium]